MILLRTASDLSHFSMVGNAIVKKTVSSCMKLLQGSFYSENHRFVRQCLSLLSALVSQGPEAAREVLGQIRINKALSGLAKRKDKKGKPDVRMAFIQFVLSFLVSGDNTTVGQILEIKELLPEILSTGLKEDRMSIVNLILSTLKTRVLLNKAISKTQKVRFFTPAVLANIASLYRWNGIVDATTDDNRIYESQPDVSTVFQTCEVVPLPRLHSMIMVISLPPVCNKAFFTQGLSLANTAVQLTTLSMINFILKRANKNIEYLLDKSECHNSDVYTLDVMGELVQQYRETLSKILPDMTSIVAKWQSLSKKEKTNGEEKVTKPEGSAPQTDNKNEMPVAETAEVILLKALILQVICLYQKVVPHLDVDTESSSGEKSVLYLLLKMFVSSSSSSHLKTSTKMLVLKVLKDSGVFEYTWTELELWLDQLDRVEPDQQETVIQFLERGWCLSTCPPCFQTVLHCQREPLPLCLALLQYDKELASSEPSASSHPSIIHLHQYYSKWLPQQCREELFKSPESHSKASSTPTSFTALMKAAYSQGPSAFLEDAFRKSVGETLASMSMADFPVAIKQILLYIKSTVENLGTFSKDIGTAPLKTLMEILQDLVTRLQGYQDTTNPEPAAENSQEGSELFLEINQSPTVEANKEQILLSALGSIFKHPCLEQWFLALELAALPPHTLNPVRLKNTCAQLSDDILALLKTSTPTLCDLGHLELICTYMGSIEKAVLKELMEKGSRPCKETVQTFPGPPVSAQVHGLL
ncbi:Nucleolar pre-ribosomal-associated protein 1 [Larimichthys crocea]|uniref:Uncharacterized protein n=1 Tax=Larimichthys crocea TaxID=215358 RepID=A0ACD3QJL5_LARCR|nr:Nucleolar pre-ribosomal-associated protein 1 [Larimichthys crocea]